MKQIITFDGKDYFLHTLKILKQYWVLVEKGLKTCELRINDRDFKEGELIYFVVIDDKKNKITHANGFYKITHVLKDVPEYGLNENYAILSIKKLELNLKDILLKKRN